MARNAERRTLLADAAVRVLAQHGSRGLTHRAIDAAAEVPKGTASNYFSSRDEIIDAILLRIGERLQPDPAIHANLAQQPPSIDLFAAYLHDIVHRLTTDRDAAIALFELRLEATRRQHVAEVLTSWRRAGLRADIEFNDKMALPGQPSDITLFHYALDGLILDQLSGPLDEATDANQAVSELAHRLLGG